MSKKKSRGKTGRVSFNICTTRILRRISQLFFFFLLVMVVASSFCNFILPGLNYTLGCPFGALQISLASLRFAVPLLLSALTLIIITFIFGRIFCGWACPIGFILDAIDWLIERIYSWSGRDLRRLKLGKLDDRRHKYAALGGAVLVSPLFRRAAFCPICPVGALCRSSGAQEQNLRLETAIIPMVGLLSFSTKRFWCRNLCPIGGLLGLLGSRSIKKVRLPVDRCLECGACERACPVGLPILEKTREKLKEDPEVRAVLEEIDQPDLLDKPHPIHRLPEEVQKILKERGPEYAAISSRECLQCHECVLACPMVLKKELSVELGEKGSRLASG